MKLHNSVQLLGQRMAPHVNTVWFEIVRAVIVYLCLSLAIMLYVIGLVFPDASYTGSLLIQVVHMYKKLVAITFPVLITTFALISICTGLILAQHTHDHYTERSETSGCTRRCNLKYGFAFICAVISLFTLLFTKEKINKDMANCDVVHVTSALLLLLGTGLMFARGKSIHDLFNPSQ